MLYHTIRPFGVSVPRNTAATSSKTFSLWASSKISSYRKGRRKTNWVRKCLFMFVFLRLFLYPVDIFQEAEKAAVVLQVR